MSTSHNRPVEAGGLVKRFGTVTAICDLTLHLDRGEALGLLIPALCGPSTEVIIADPRRPDARAFVDGMQAAGWGYRREDLPVPGRIDETGAIVHVHRFTPPARKHNESVVI